MLQVGRHDMIAARHQPKDDQVEGVGGVVSETEPFRNVLIAAEKAGQALAQIMQKVPEREPYGYWRQSLAEAFLDHERQP